MNQPCLIGILLSLAVGTTAVRGEDQFELPPINYSKTKPTDRVAKLEADLKSGRLKIDPKLSEKEFVEEVLKHLGIPVGSQALVFSKTSLQNSHINPKQPRALYFNEEIYFGWSHGSGVFEIIDSDPKLGATFYLIERDTGKSDVGIFRESADCFSCHAAGRTGGRPGLLVRSLYVSDSGQPIFSAGSFSVGHDTPFENRWGGWYVTGHHGDARHLGNIFAEEMPDGRAAFDRDPGANLRELDQFFDTDEYLAATSDIVALMVLEHQAGMHNRLIEGNFTVRSAIYRSRQLNRELGVDNPDKLSETTLRIIENQAERILKHLLFCEEAPLPEGGIDSKGKFPEEFHHNARATKDGRSLKDFQLLDRLFKYRCSYMVYSEAFASLPKELKIRVLARLREGLEGNGDAEIFGHLSESERERIHEILTETLPEFSNT